MQQSQQKEAISVPNAIKRDGKPKTGICIICLELSGWHYGNSHKYGKRKTLRMHRNGSAQRLSRMRRRKQS